MLTLGLFAPLATGQDSPAKLVRIESGNLPLILSAPHGGNREIPQVPERRGIGVAKFKNRSDLNTGLLTIKLANAIEKKLGQRPYTIIARFHRRFVDANRAPELAYESPRAKGVYVDYHQALAKARSEVSEKWGRGILFDIHGQASKPRAIIRGTQNGSTTRHLVNRFGREALVGKSSLFGRLAAEGFPVIPPVGASDREPAGYSGGYIVVTYGSRDGGTVDAIQLELGRKLRDTSVLDATASKLAAAISSFANEYLPVSPQ